MDHLAHASWRRERMLLRARAHNRAAQAPGDAYDPKVPGLSFAFDYIGVRNNHCAWNSLSAALRSLWPAPGCPAWRRHASAAGKPPEEWPWCWCPRVRACLQSWLRCSRTSAPAVTPRRSPTAARRPCSRASRTSRRALPKQAAAPHRCARCVPQQRGGEPVRSASFAHASRGVGVRVQAATPLWEKLSLWIETHEEVKKGLGESWDDCGGLEQGPATLPRTAPRGTCVWEQQGTPASRHASSVRGVPLWGGARRARGVCGQTCAPQGGCARCTRGTSAWRPAASTSSTRGRRTRRSSRSRRTTTLCTTPPCEWDA